jgi:uncharacterized protein (TIGR02996 family)
VTEDELLFAAALAEPAEDTPRLVFADWLTEHGEDDLAAALRDHRDIVAYLGELTRWDVSPSRRSQRYDRDREELRDLFPPLPAAQLLTRYRHLFPVPPGAPTQFDVNALPPLGFKGIAPPGGFLSRWQHARTKQIALVRELAARAADRPVADQPAFTPADDPRTVEEQACLLHELVLRGRNVHPIAGAAAHAERMRDRGHPLAWLPLRLLAPDAELSAHVPRFGANGAVAFGAPIVGEPLPPRAVGVDAPAVVGSDEFPIESPLFAAVRGWLEESNGRAEGWAFRLDRPLDPVAVGRLWFSRLPADALNAALVTPQWAVDRVEASGALAVLFGAAHNGGAYGRREWGAYGRLGAWRSLAALAGCPPTAGPEAVEQAAGACRWFTFGGTQWFAQVAWDLGLFCLRPDGRTVALLAATDAD